MGHGQSLPERGAASLAPLPPPLPSLTAVAPLPPAASSPPPAFRGNSKDNSMVELDLTSRLSEDCLALVFSKLRTLDRNSCSLVCHRWFTVESQARQLLLLLARAELLSVLPSLLERFQHLTKLALKCDRKYLSIDDGALFLIGKYARQLERLKLKGCRQVTDKGLEGFAVMCGRLRKLSCGSCGFGAKGLNALLENCQLLEDLSVKKLKNMFEEPDELVGGGSSHWRLKRLCLKDLANAHVFTPLIAGSTHLQTLILARVSGNWDTLLDPVVGERSALLELRVEKIHIGDRGLQAVARCKTLQTLYVVKCPDVSNAGVLAVASGCRGLRKLHLDGCFAGRIGDQGLKGVGERCAQLQELVLIRLNAGADSLSVIAARCTSLERLAVCNSESFGDGELSCLVFRCHVLKKLCIKSCTVSDHGLAAIATGCPNLVKIKVKKCRGVTLAGASLLQQHRPNLAIVVDSPPQQVVVNPEDAVAAQAQRQAPGPARMMPARSGFVKARLGWLGVLRR